MTKESQILNVETSLANRPVGALRGGRCASAWSAILLACLMMSGCGGCGEGDSAADKSGSVGKSSKSKSKTKRKPDYEISSLAVMPGSGAARRVKPGHWATATHEVTANNFDTVCDFEAQPRENGQPIDWEGTLYRLHTSRPAQLPKGKTRFIQTVFFIPEISAPAVDTLRLDEVQTTFDENLGAEVYRDGDKTYVVDPYTGDWKRAPRRVRLSSSLHQRGGGLIQQQQPALVLMKPHEYHFVVLAPKAAGYMGWQKLASLRPPHESANAAEEFDVFDDFAQPTDTHYHLVIPPIKKNRPLAISSHPLTWTSIAYVLWDEMDPLMLSAEQQQAMLDWLHWGGRLIISGPKSLDLLRGSFLAPYLPAVAESAVEIEQSDLQPLNDLLAGRRGTARRLRISKPWAGVKLAFKNEENEIPGVGGLLAEGRVGRGRIVISAFRLRERELFAWPMFDSLVNTMLLRRGPRTLVVPDGSDEVTQVAWKHRPDHLDPRAISDVRYLSRDFGDGKKRSGQRGAVASRSVAGWNDHSPVSVAARDSLRKAAGIDIPKASFIVWVMAVYLIILVPINWGVFRLLGRVELAWVAAPVITLIYTGVVVQLAQLDIGFARSRTEYCIVEAQGGYSRAHVTRYTALYASLSTGYEFEFDDDSALIGPFSTGATVAANQSRSTITMRREESVRAEGFDVSSNSTGMIHSEQMYDLGGTIRLVGRPGAERIANGSKLSLQGVAVIRPAGSDKDRLLVAWVGQLPAGEQAPLGFFATTQSEAVSRQLLAAQESSSSGDLPGLTLDGLLRLAYQHRPLAKGESRLIAWTDEEVPGMTITPAASRVRRATLVVVHLNYALDRNSPELDVYRSQTR